MHYNNFAHTCKENKKKTDNSHTVLQVNKKFVAFDNEEKGKIQSSP